LCEFLRYSNLRNISRQSALQKMTMRPLHGERTVIAMRATFGQYQVIGQMRFCRQSLALLLVTGGA
jgi:hypothetical protein